MTTFTQLTDEVLMKMEALLPSREIIGTVAGDLDSDASTADIYIQGLRPGIVEIQDELIYIPTVLDKTSLQGEFYSECSGMVRGYRGTTPYSPGLAPPIVVAVRVNPRFPRHAVKEAINDTIEAIFPRLAAVKSVTGTTETGVTRYDLFGQIEINEGEVEGENLNLDTTQVEKVLSVFWEPDSTTGAVLPVQRWRHDISTPGYINLFGLPGGKTFTVNYFVAPIKLSANSDEFVDTGLPVYAKDAVVLGACARLAAFLDVTRVTTTSAEQGLLNQLGQQGSVTGVKISQYLLALYEQRLTECERRFAKEYAVKKHWIS